MKIIGIMMIALACSTSGFVISQKYIEVLKGVQRAEDFIKNIIICIRNERMSIPDIFNYLFSFSDDYTKRFIDILVEFDFKNIDKKAFESGFCNDKTACKILREVFLILGRLSAEEQIKELEFARNKLTVYREKIYDELINKAKFSKKIGVISGVFIAVIML